MPFIPHTAAEAQVMLSAIGVDAIDDLFDEIPAGLKNEELSGLSAGLSEMEMLAAMQARADADPSSVCFLGAGAYDHHIPAAVWDLTSRGEFMTAYTPYQAEASQGTLQLIYEYQTMMANLTALDVSNASVYDGASGLAEAILMALRANKKARSRRVLLPASVHPHYREAARNICRHQGLDFVDLPVADDGRIDLAALTDTHADAAALVIPQPSFFGLLEDVDRLTNWATERQIVVIAVVNPLSLAVLKPPGQWGEQGADIACGDGQPFGIPMASGGPSFGFICSTQKLVRQLPGRLIGRTSDLEGRCGFTLTLQAREQHIRRGKATSNICTNQGLLVTAGTIHMSIMGAAGLARVAERCLANTRELVDRLVSIEGVEEQYSGAYFHERVLRLPRSSASVRDGLLEHGILGGLPLGDYFPEMQNCLLVCATEKRTAAEIEAYAGAMQAVLSA
jgi:glycine dehydrogenase subunit 1